MKYYQMFFLILFIIGMPPTLSSKQIRRRVIIDTVLYSNVGRPLPKPGPVHPHLPVPAPRPAPRPAK